MSDETRRETWRVVLRVTPETGEPTLHTVAVEVTFPCDVQAYAIGIETRGHNAWSAVWRWAMEAGDRIAGALFYEHEAPYDAAVEPVEVLPPGVPTRAEIVAEVRRLYGDARAVDADVAAHFIEKARSETSAEVAELVRRLADDATDLVREAAEIDGRTGVLTTHASLKRERAEGVAHSVQTIRAWLSGVTT